MPINFLQEINTPIALGFPVQGAEKPLYSLNQGEQPFAIYRFSCKDLKTSQPLFNDGLPTLIFLPAKSEKVHLVRNGQFLAFKSAWLCCGPIKNTYWDIPETLDSILVLRFQPSYFYSLFSIPGNLFLNQAIFNLEDIVSEDWMCLFDKMYAKEGWSARISYLETLLNNAPLKATSFPALLNFALSYIDSTKGNCTISQVLAQLGKSVNERWLLRNFVKYIGMSPKKYIGIQRFVFTYASLRLSKEINSPAILLAAGYYDYNHFLKDFKQYLGIAPTQYVWD